ncbi:MAG TPA: right-handed parallel beta-helix repeat-containing protein, partial [Phycisphaerae bacterium]|nr:right-handed parallel beta-helix repeat-containing protein [Phycisphaerae bacterium]
MREPSVTSRKNPDLDALGKLAAKAPPLPAPQGPVVRVATAEELYKAVKDAKPGTTVFLADGVYQMTSSLVISTDRLALRGQSGDREKVILDRGGRGRGGCVMVAGADDVLIADLTIRNSATHGVHVQPERGAQRTKIYNVKFHNIFVRHIKGSHPKYPHEPVEPYRDEILRKRPVGGEIRYCLFVNDGRKTDANDGFGGDYVGGIDMMWLKDWTIADNVFVGIRGRNGIGRGAIFIWVHSENVTAERNIIINCDRGICFGNPSGSPVHMTGGIVRNNLIVTGASQGIEICRTENTLVAHNTVYATGPTHPSAVQFHQHTRNARFVNNLVHGQVRLTDGVTE